MIPFKDNIPSRRYPLITVTLIAANIAAFFYELSLPKEALETFFRSYGVVPTKVGSLLEDPLTGFPTVTVSLFTSMFLHGGIIHLLGNMWYLWIFGDNVEDRMGPFRFVLFYLLCGLIASFTHISFSLGSETPSIGASGAVTGVLGAYLISFPFARVLTLIPIFFFWHIVELPAILVLGAWFFIQLFNGAISLRAASEMMGGVAWWAHIGGFLAGMVLITLFARRPVRRYYWD